MPYKTHTRLPCACGYWARGSRMHRGAGDAVFMAVRAPLCSSPPRTDHSLAAAGRSCLTRACWRGREMLFLQLIDSGDGC